MKIKTLLLVAALGGTLVAHAQDVTVTVEKAGGLTALPLGTVTLSGTVNKADFTTLDQLSGVTVAKLDLQGVAIEKLETDGGVEYPANEIPDSAFLTRWHLNDNGAAVWDKNEAILGVVLPASITTVGKAAFYNIAATSIDFSACKNLTTIKANAFDMTNVDKIDLTGLTALETIEPYGFDQTHAAEIVLDGCSALTAIDERAFCQSYFVTSTSFKGLTALKTIGNRAFLNLGKNSGDCGEIDLTPCTALETIDECAFQSAKTKSVKFPASLKTIEAKAFNLAKDITSITFEGAVPPTLGATAFTNAVMSNAEVTVPEGSEQAYRDLGFEKVNTAAGVAAVRMSTASSAPVYDLQGRQVVQPTSGVFVQDGKKVVIK